MKLDYEDARAIAEQLAPILARMLGRTVDVAEPGGVDVYRMRQAAQADLAASKASIAAKRAAKKARLCQ